MNRSVYVCERASLPWGSTKHLCRTFLLLIDFDDTIFFYTLSLVINENYAMLFNCHQ